MNPVEDTICDHPRGVVGQLLLGRYRVLRAVGRGAQAVVYEAEHVRLHRRVAIKLCLVGADRAQALARFQREAEILARIHHPSIAAVHDADVFTDGETPLLVMEWLDGESVRAWLQRGRAMPWRQAFPLVAQAADALQAAHALGIVHRDLKPDNLFLCKGGMLKVLDFGIAFEQPLGDAPPTRRLTAVNTILGTPSYMSPEQIRCVRDLDGRSDIYSLGCVLYNLLSARRVWPRVELPVIARLVATSAPIDIQVHVPTLPDPAARVLRLAMERDRAQRFQTMAQLRAALLAAARTEEDVPPAATSARAIVSFTGTTTVDLPREQASDATGPTVLLTPTLATRQAKPVPTRVDRAPPSPGGGTGWWWVLIAAAVLGMVLAVGVAMQIGR
jgi:serine/threonine-protein kinase